MLNCCCILHLEMASTAGNVYRLARDYLITSWNCTHLIIADCKMWLVNNRFRISCGILLVVFLCGTLHSVWYSWYPTAKQSVPNNFTSTELEKPSLHRESNEFVPNNLPHIRGPFVGRESELLGISNMLLSNSAGVAMVSIFGPPAAGKSTLAIQVGHKLASKGMSVRYVNLNEAYHLFAR